jgi:predicted Zn-dependent protease
MGMTSFSARGVLDGMSFLCGRAGEQLCDERISITDEPGFAHPAAVGSPFDAEGVPRRRVAMLDHGRAGDCVSDRGTAARLGLESTGHAPSGTNDLTDGPVPANLVFHAGADSVEDMVAHVERGLYVTRFHYVNGLLDTRKATMTGMTRDGTFLIEDGRVGRGVKNLRFTDSILAAFGRVGGIGRDLQSVPTSWAGHGAYLCPALLLRGLEFTGRSR